MTTFDSTRAEIIVPILGHGDRVAYAARTPGSYAEARYGRDVNVLRAAGRMYALGGEAERARNVLARLRQLAEDAAPPRSPCSSRITRKPRPAASRATLTPFNPPPMIARS